MTAGPGEPRRFRSQQGLVDLALLRSGSSSPRRSQDGAGPCSSQLGAAVREQCAELDGPRRNDERGHVLAARARRYRHDVRSADGRVAEQRRLDLGRRDVGARRLDHVLDAAEEVHGAALVEPSQVAGVEVSLRVEAVARCEPVVVREQGRAAHADLARGSASVGSPLSGSQMRARPAGRASPGLDAVILSEARLRAKSQGAAESARRGQDKDLEVS